MLKLILKLPLTLLPMLALALPAFAEARTERHHEHHAGVFAEAHSKTHRETLAEVRAKARAEKRPEVREYSLVINEETVRITGKPLQRLTLNGTIPGPTLEFVDGDEAVIHVTNNLKEHSSVHWHGLLLPGEMDGVSGFNGFAGIAPGTTFTYRFKIRQTGTYWYHAHSFGQEQDGHYGALVIHPRASGLADDAMRDAAGNAASGSTDGAARRVASNMSRDLANGAAVTTAAATAEPMPNSASDSENHIQADRDYVVLFSDFHEDDSKTIMANLKKDSEYYVYTRRTVGDFFDSMKAQGFDEAWKNTKMWGEMRMSQTDLTDIGNYTFLVNGKTPAANWTGIFKVGERVRLRFINASAMSFFDVRIPGLKMTVVAADGQAVEPVTVDEFRFAVAETYDVIVQPQQAQAYAIVAEPLDRTGFALATLAPREGLRAPAPTPRKRALLSMADMGMAHGEHGGDAGHGEHSGHGERGKHAKHARHGDDAHAMHASDAAMPAERADHSGHAGHSKHAQHAGHAGHDKHAKHAGHAEHAQHKTTDATMPPVDDFDTGVPDSGWADADTPQGAKALSYKDLRYYGTQADQRPPDREIVVRLGGNMERYAWTLNDRKFPHAEPIRLNYGERVRLIFVNDTMMAHPMHLHGMFVQLENGQPMGKLPNKHTFIVAPGDTYSALLTANEAGEWAFHCHLLYHMLSGMMGKLVVATLDESQMPKQPAARAQEEARNADDHSQMHH